MRLNEIKDKKWILSDEMEVYKVKEDVPIEEQEMHINIISSRMSEKGIEEAHICCSLQKGITKLSHNHWFLLRQLTIVANPKEGNELVVQVVGEIKKPRIPLIRPIVPKPKNAFKHKQEQKVENES